MEESPAPLLIITAAAVVAPICSETLKRFKVPVVLFELLLGILIGPQVLNWVQVTDFISSLSRVGLAFLMLLAGYHVDLARVRGAPLRLGVLAWVTSLALGLAVSAALQSAGLVISDLLVGLALTTTALGILLPILHDRGLIDGDFGRFTLAAGAMGEFGPIIAVTLLLSNGSPGGETLLLIAFVVVALLAAAIATRTQPQWLTALLDRHMTTSTQLPVRIVILLLTAMVLLTFHLGLDTLLGSFTAGMLLRLVRTPAQAEKLDPKLESIGFGFLIPIFFIVSGMKFDLDALIDNVSAIVRLPIFLALMLVLRGGPALVFYRKVLPSRERLALTVMQATALPLVVVITTIGLESERMRPETAAALVGAAMLSVLIFPLVGLALLPKGPASGPQHEGTGDGPGEISPADA